jgi:4-alpha-glucanotransferase
MKTRGCGILLHITSLPSPYGIGDFGPTAYSFADLMAENLQSFWQVLPLGPTDPIFGNTPYDSRSAFAGNPLLISPDLLLKDGLLSTEDLLSPPDFPKKRVDYPLVMDYKRKLFDRAFAAFLKRDKAGDRIDEGCDYRRFCSQNGTWLDDFALFSAIKSSLGGISWSRWTEAIKDRRSDELQKMKDPLHDEIVLQKFLQYIFFKQWNSLRGYCNRKGIQIIGDVPIYVNHDSADVWTRPDIFKLDAEKNPTTVAGVPPDYFSKTGQLWGNPIYRWDVLQKERYAWWIRRLEHNLRLFDIIRVDHFRGLVSYWEVKAGQKTAVEGEWVKVPTEDFLNTLFRRFPNLPMIAEDLGLITPDVREVISSFGLPGMRLLLFAFGEGLPENPYAPHNHVKNCVIYTGTHDNNTARGWFEHEAMPEDRQRLFSYLGRQVSADQVSGELIRMAMMSVADVAILPMQDILGLGEEARMNWPGRTNGIYEWRLLPEQLRLDPWLREMTEIYHRA